MMRIASHIEVDSNEQLFIAALRVEHQALAVIATPGVPVATIDRAWYRVATARYVIRAYERFVNRRRIPREP